LAPIKSRYRLSRLDLVVRSRSGTEETIYFVAAASPAKTGNDLRVKASDEDGLQELKLTRPRWIKTTEKDVRIDIMKRHLTTPRAARSAPTNIFKADGTFRVGGTWARRHVLSSYDMKAHYEFALCLPNNTTVTAGRALTARGFPPASQDKGAIKPAAQALLTKFHNDAENIWVGDTRENSRLQENVDAAPSMYDASGQIIVERVSQHIQIMANRYAIPGVAMNVSNKYNVPVTVTYNVIDS
jgi:hypothetical protein